MLFGFRSKLTPEHSRIAEKTVEVEPTEEKIVQEETVGELKLPL